MKFNVIIAERDRPEHLKLCLDALQAAKKDHDVSIYVVSDYIESTHPVCWVPIEREEPFCKSKYLNLGLKNMRQDFDFVSIVDADIIYRPDFFDVLSQVKEDIWFISGGYKLHQTGTELYLRHGVRSWFESCLYVDDTLRSENVKQLYPSQITLSKALYKKVLTILQQEDLYCEEFVGWGGEDSELSMMSTVLRNRRIIKKVYNPDMWYHLWHEKEINQSQHRANVTLLHNRLQEHNIKIKSYCGVS